MTDSSRGSGCLILSQATRVRILYPPLTNCVRGTCSKSLKSNKILRATTLGLGLATTYPKISCKQMVTRLYCREKYLTCFNKR